MRTTSQIVAALYDDRNDDVSLADRLCRACTRDLRLTGAGLSVGDETGLLGVMGASDPVVDRLDGLQFELGEGPCADAARGQKPAWHPFLGPASVAEWPGFAPAALDQGIRAVFALPLRAVTVQLGVLGLYRSVAGPLDRHASVGAQAYADAAVVLLLHLQAGMADGELQQDVETSVMHNAEVHQASGFVSVTASVGVAEALLLLRARAFAVERPLLQVARDVLTGRLVIGAEGSQDG